MIYLPTALELANQRTRELDHHAREIELLALASLAGRLAPYRDPDDPRQQEPRPRRPSLARRVVARPVRALSGASRALAEAACTAATRIEGSAASR